jgi:hypothetical protein
MWADPVQLKQYEEAFKRLQQAGMVTNGMTPGAGLIVALVARSAYGITDPFEAWNCGLYVVKGRLSQEGRFMLTRIRQAGHEVGFKWDRDSKVVTAIGYRRQPDGSLLEVDSVEWGPSEDKQAGLAELATHKNYPRAMYKWRAVAELGRTAFSEIIGPFKYTPEEAEHAEPINPARIMSVTVDGVTTEVEAPAEDGLLAAVATAAVKPTGYIGEDGALFHEFNAKLGLNAAIQYIRDNGGDDEVLSALSNSAWATVGMDEPRGVPSGTTAFEQPEQAKDWYAAFRYAADAWYASRNVPTADDDDVTDADFEVVPVCEEPPTAQGTEQPPLFAEEADAAS